MLLSMSPEVILHVVKTMRVDNVRLSIHGLWWICLKWYYDLRFLSAGSLEDETEYYKTIQELIQYNQVLIIDR